MTVVAAPVIAAGRMEGAVTLAAPAVRLPAEKIAQMGARMAAAARTIAKRLEGTLS
jgi:DNA-binding IclR family transcriptional regulator